MNLAVNSVRECSPIKRQSPSFGNTFCIIKPEMYSKRAEIVAKHIIPAGFKVVKSWKGVAPVEVLAKHYDNISKKPFFGEVLDYMHGGKICILELDGGKNDVEKFRNLTLNRLRPIFATDKAHNGVHASDSVSSAAREINEVWGNFLNHIV